MSVSSRSSSISFSSLNPNCEEKARKYEQRKTLESGYKVYMSYGKKRNERIFSQTLLTRPNLVRAEGAFPTSTTIGRVWRLGRSTNRRTSGTLVTCENGGTSCSIAQETGVSPSFVPASDVRPRQPRVGCPIRAASHRYRAALQRLP